jgi:hypothetical protein
LMKGGYRSELTIGRHSTNTKWLRIELIRSDKM